MSPHAMMMKLQRCRVGTPKHQSTFGNLVWGQMFDYGMLLGQAEHSRPPGGLSRRAAAT